MLKVSNLRKSFEMKEVPRGEILMLKKGKITAVV